MQSLAELINKRTTLTDLDIRNTSKFRKIKVTYNRKDGHIIKAAATAERGEQTIKTGRKTTINVFS